MNNISITAVDEDSGQTVQSQGVTLMTQQPDFIIISSRDGLKVPVGSDARVASIKVEMSSNLPYPVHLNVNYDRLLDGIYVELDEDSISGIQTFQTDARISVSEGSPIGYYVVPFVASSGLLEHRLNLSVEVISPSKEVYSGWVKYHAACGEKKSDRYSVRLRRGSSLTPKRVFLMI